MIIFFSSAEDNAHARDLKIGGVSNVLVSWHSMTKGKKPESAEASVNKVLECWKKPFCDSGAHTFQKGISEPEFDKKVNEYGAFVQKNSHRLLTCVEIDVYNLFSIPKIDGIRHELRKVAPNLMPVWHKVLGEKRWDEYCEEYKYIGISLLSSMNLAEMFPKIKRAWEKGVKVHGFGITDPQKMSFLPFYSVDSTSWLKCEMYGFSLRFENGVLKTERSLRQLAKAKKTPKDIGIFSEYKDKRINSIKCYLKLEKYITDLWTARGVKWT